MICEQYETCDDNNTLNDDACLATCLEASCGDGYVRTDLALDDPLFEECDDGDQSANCRADCGLRVAIAISTQLPVKPVMTVMR